MVRPLTPPWAFTYLKYAFDAGAISSYPGAAGPVSGCVLPMVTDVAVTPGADAALAPEPDDPLPHAAVITAMVAPAVATAQVLDLLISERIPVLLLLVDPLLSDALITDVVPPVLSAGYSPACRCDAV